MSEVRHYTQTGRFYLGREERQQQVVLITPAGTVSTLWDEGEAPYSDDMLPSEVSQILRARIKSYWICTSRDEDYKKLDAIDANTNEFDRMFMTSRAAHLEAKADRLLKEAKRLRYAVEELEQEAGQ